MIAMDQIQLIRNLYFIQGETNISEIARITGYNWKTIQKYIDKDDFNDPNPMPTAHLRCPKLDPFKPMINEWLEEDKLAPRKQRHTAKKVYRRLKNEAKDFDCSYSLVAEYVSEKKKELHLKQKEGFIPLLHNPGEAQADFGAADFFENGKRYSGKYFVLTFPYSNTGYIQLHYGENMECLLESLKAIFEHIGGVPSEIWFDNTSTIVTGVLKGGDRNTTEKFNRFREHYGFHAVFMNPYSGNEKGNVEAKVKYFREELLVPMPRFLTLAAYNQQLLEDCDKDSDRMHYRTKTETIEERFGLDRKAFRSLPDKPFDTASYEKVTPNKWGKFSYGNVHHTYSASPGLAGVEVWIRVTAEFITVLDQSQNEIITHRRLYGDEVQESMEWLPYLKYIARKPRSLRNSGIYEMMPDTMQNYMDQCSNGDRGHVLKILSDLTERTGFDSALCTVGQAVKYQVTDPDSLKNLYRRLYADVPELPPLKAQPDIPTISQMPANLSAYDSLLGRRCAT